MSAPDSVRPDECTIYRWAILAATNQHCSRNTFYDTTGVFVVREMLAMRERCTNHHVTAIRSVELEIGPDCTERIATYKETLDDKSTVADAIYRHRPLIAREVRAMLPWREWAWAQLTRWVPRSL